jgi:hypothetical protein
MKNHLKTKSMMILLAVLFFTQLNCYKITSSFKRVIYSGHLQKPVDPEKLTLGSDRDYRVFQRTPVWDLAFALAVGDLGEVEELAKKHKNIINTPEPKYGTTLLSYAIRNGQKNAVQILLENGANPNVSPKPPESLKNTPISRNSPGNIMNPGFQTITMTTRITHLFMQQLRHLPRCLESSLKMVEILTFIQT